MDRLIENLVFDSDDSDIDFEESILFKWALDSSLKRKRKRKRDHLKNYIDSLISNFSEMEFVSTYRVSRKVFEKLVYDFSKSNFFSKLKYNGKLMSAEHHILTFLWFSGQEIAGFRDVADHFDMCISSLHRVLKRVTVFIGTLAPMVIKMPNSEERKRIASFFSKNGFNGAIGVIDRCHILINPPKEEKDDYINHKGDATIILQGIFNHERKFINVFVGLPGSTHEDQVFQSSPISTELPTHCEGLYYLLGDSAYACGPHLITPYKDNGQLTKAQTLFNSLLCSSRTYTENTFEMLKLRFRRLYHCKLKSIKYLSDFVTALCVLHNMCDLKELELIGIKEWPMSARSSLFNVCYPCDDPDIPSGKKRRNAICSAIAKDKINRN